jgi:cell division protein YceG involved in septum cleavage
MGKMKELYILAQDLSAQSIIQLISDAEEANNSFVVVEGRQIPIEKARAIASILKSTIENQFKSLPGDA